MKLLKKLSSGDGELPEHWIKKTNKEGKTYYVHMLTLIATYEKPQPLPAGWRMAKDPDSGVCYFWNEHTRETRKCDWAAPPPPPPPPPSAGSAEIAGGAAAPPSKQVTDVTDAAPVSSGSSGASGGPPPPPPPPPPLATDSVRVHLSREAFGAITFAPSKDGRALTVSKMRSSEATTSLHVGAELLAVNDVPCADSAAKTQALLGEFEASDASSIDIEVRLPAEHLSKQRDAFAPPTAIHLGAHVSGDL